MEFFKEKDPTPNGVIYFYAKPGDFDQAICVAIQNRHYVNSIRLSIMPKEDGLQPATREEFAEAFNKATKFFADVLSINS